MLRDLVTEQEPKGVSVPIPESAAEVTKAMPQRRHRPVAGDRSVPSKRLRAMHRRSLSKLSLKEWLRTLRNAEDRNTVSEWYRNKQGRGS